MSAITNSFRKKHKHSWALLYDLPAGYKVRQCQLVGCAICESKMWDFLSRKWVWIPGNYLIDVKKPVYIIAGNYDEFLVVKQILTTGPAKEECYDVKFVRGYEDFDKNDAMPAVFFYGTWYDNGILEDPRVTAYLNHRR